jgi:hypothetical protein
MNRHLYVCPLGEGPKLRHQWAILQSMQSTELDETGVRPAPVFEQLTAGHPSLARLLSDALALFLQAAGTANLTITDRTAPFVQACWMPAEPIAVEGIVGDRPATILLPEDPTQSPNRWCHISRANGRLAWSSTTRFIDSTLPREFASLFNAERVISDKIDPGSPIIKAIEYRHRSVELWLRPQWAAVDLLPPGTIPAQPRPLVRRPEDEARRVRIDQLREQKQRHQRDREAKAAFDKGQATWRANRMRELAAERPK